MATARPSETTMEITDEGQRLSQVIHRVAHGEIRVVVEENGLPVAAIISADEYRRFKDQEQERETARATLFQAFTRFGEAFKDVPDEELEREIANAQREVREELRAERAAQDTR